MRNSLPTLAASEEVLIYVAESLSAIAEPDALRVLRQLDHQPKSVAEIAFLERLEERDVARQLHDLERAEIVAGWGKASFVLAPRGRDVWDAIRPLFKNGR